MKLRNTDVFDLLAVALLGSIALIIVWLSR